MNMRERKINKWDIYVYMGDINHIHIYTSLYIYTPAAFLSFCCVIIMYDDGTISTKWR